MRQTGVMAAPGLVSLKKHVPLVKEDRDIAILIAKKINEELSDFIEYVSTDLIHINMLFFNVK